MGMTVLPRAALYNIVYYCVHVYVYIQALTVKSNKDIE